jgi:hypothetical protein
VRIGAPTEQTLSWCPIHISSVEKNGKNGI